jgi:hypothetical protein
VALFGALNVRLAPEGPGPMGGRVAAVGGRAAAVVGRAAAVGRRAAAVGASAVGGRGGAVGASAVGAADVGVVEEEEGCATPSALFSCHIKETVCLIIATK